MPFLFSLFFSLKATHLVNLSSESHALPKAVQGAPKDGEHNPGMVREITAQRPGKVAVRTQWEGNVSHLQEN